MSEETRTIKKRYFHLQTVAKENASKGTRIAALLQNRKLTNVLCFISI